MPKPKTTRSCPKTLYRVKNWSEYDKALVQRGSLTIWLSDDFEKSWQYAGEKQRGSQFDYSAHVWQHGNTHAERLKRDENLRSIRNSGRKAWKENSGYRMRSLAQTTILVRPIMAHK